MTTKSLVAIVVGIAGCSAGNVGGGSSQETDSEIIATDIPIGTFCVSVDGTETCAPMGDIRATRNESGGNVGFEVVALFDPSLSNDFEMSVTGRIPSGATVPRESMVAGFEINVSGVCQYSRPDRNGSGCGWEEGTPICQLLNIDADVSLQVIELTPNEVAAVLEGTAPLLASCCSSQPPCDEAPARFEPPGPFEVGARIHVSF